MQTNLTVVAAVADLRQDRRDVEPTDADIRIRKTRVSIRGGGPSNPRTRIGREGTLERVAHLLGRTGTSQDNG